MSRIGKLPVELPEGVAAEVKDRSITIKGPKGELSFDFGYKVDIKEENGSIIASQRERTKQSKSMWGTARSIIFNMVKGVTEGFEKKLELHGVGYRMDVQGDILKLNLGFSHPVEKKIPEGLQASIDKNVLTISGVNKEQVGEFAAKVRTLRKVEPYKGKGFRYEGEEFIKKEGKRAGGGGE
ncbi:MAG: 50S ribosomal protein L6 [Candidatus Moranbacteria bacterium]|nr:50S ribosomal protein L6 [Candidatus Moranbacteria bacterium]